MSATNRIPFVVWPINQRFIQKTLKDCIGNKNRKIFGADIFVPIEAQILRPPGAYSSYVTKGAKHATKSDTKRSSQKGCLGLYGQVNKRIR